MGVKCKNNYIRYIKYSFNVSVNAAFKVKKKMQTHISIDTYYLNKLNHFCNH